MDFETAVKFVDAYIDNTNDDMRSFYKMIVNHISLMKEESPIPYYNESMVRSMVNVLMYDSLEGTSSWPHIQFLEAMSSLVYNWNRNLLKDESVGLQCRMIKRIVVDIVHARHSIDAMKDAIELILRYRNWMPPAYDLSIEYLESLLNKNEAKQS